jgi:hypothetical protein
VRAEFRGDAPRLQRKWKRRLREGRTRGERLTKCRAPLQEGSTAPSGTPCSVAGAGPQGTDCHQTHVRRLRESSTVAW